MKPGAKVNDCYNNNNKEMSKKVQIQLKMNAKLAVPCAYLQKAFSFSSSLRENHEEKIWKIMKNIFIFNFP
ncbi:CLUMA_CG013926, isoform A [Clunio marinus]|uniref:CLUMA_CG013926, isoform A n=1 Tax=Clunio marinus TaxID=568069 RepID=A0A1J1ILN6_9DIPT|nr:CLUMA_CG013926, isoform A [Clunio marinus]